MAYVKQTWECGDIVTAEKLNHMEDGIDNAQLPNVTSDDNGDVLTVVNGEWDKGKVDVGYEVTKPTATRYDGTITSQAVYGPNVAYIENLFFNDAAITVTFDDVEYVPPVMQSSEDAIYYGEAGNTYGYSFDNYPFVIQSVAQGAHWEADVTTIYTETAGEHTIKIQAGKTTVTVTDDFALARGYQIVAEEGIVWDGTVAATNNFVSDSNYGYITGLVLSDDLESLTLDQGGVIITLPKTTLMGQPYFGETNEAGTEPSFTDYYCGVLVPSGYDPMFLVSRSGNYPLKVYGPVTETVVSDDFNKAVDKAIGKLVVTGSRAQTSDSYVFDVQGSDIISALRDGKEVEVILLTTNVSYVGALYLHLTLDRFEPNGGSGQVGRAYFTCIDVIDENKVYYVSVVGDSIDYSSFSL